MRSRRRSPRSVLLLFVAIALAVAACSEVGDDDDVATSGATEDPTAATAVDPEPTSAPTTAPADLFRPTETDAAFATDGGAAGVTVDPVASGDGTEVLAGDVLQVTGDWPTDWSRQDGDISDLAVGIGRNDPRDAIAPIDLPAFESVSSASAWLSPGDPGALVEFGGEARFYPLAILTRHEIVNDRFGDVPVAVTYCPLCNTAITFDRRVDGEVLRLGVSGLLRRSDLVMWDDQTTSLWQQITGEAIAGTYAGTELEAIPTAIVSFGQFAEAHPDGWSLSTQTGFGSAYGVNPYVGYSSGSSPIGAFFQEPLDERFPALERVVGIQLGGESAAVPFSVLAEVEVVNTVVGGAPVVVLWGGDTTDALDQSDIARSQVIGTGIALDPVVDGQTLTFEAIEDGRFRDVETGSTWTLLGEAVDGELSGQRLSIVDHRNEFWFAWASFNADGTVVSG